MNLYSLTLTLLALLGQGNVTIEQRTVDLLVSIRESDQFPSELRESLPGEKTPFRLSVRQIGTQTTESVFVFVQSSRLQATRVEVTFSTPPTIRHSPLDPWTASAMQFVALAEQGPKALDTMFRAQLSKESAEDVALFCRFIGDRSKADRSQYKNRERYEVVGQKRVRVTTVTTTGDTEWRPFDLTFEADKSSGLPLVISW